MRNFQFKFILLVATILLMTACQKENMQEMVQGSATHAMTEKPERTFSMAEADKVTFIAVPQQDRHTATARNSTTILRKDTIQMGTDELYLFLFEKDSLPNPDKYKIEVTVRPFSGDPDLNLWAEGPNSSRLVRYSANYGTATDQLTFRRSGLGQQEDQMLVWLYGFTKTKFELTIQRVPVDCQEFKPADQFITADINTVCGCDGQEYVNPSAAIANGITSYTLGPCLISDYRIDTLYYVNPLAKHGDLKMLKIIKEKEEVVAYELVRRLSDDDANIVESEVAWGVMSYHGILGEKYQSSQFREDRGKTFTLIFNVPEASEPLELDLLTIGDDFETESIQKMTFYLPY